MKVYDLPKAVPAPKIDYGNYDYVKMKAAEEAHQKQLKGWLVNNGYTGPMTGKIYSHPMADGHAYYMFADRPRAKALVHLPYGDAWDHPDVKYLPIKEVVRRIKADERLTKYFKSLST